MSVLSCDRNGCENVMCDRLSYKYGYLCDECFDELVARGEGQDISEFMDSEKCPLSYHNARETFEKEFVLRD